MFIPQQWITVKRGKNYNLTQLPPTKHKRLFSAAACAAKLGTKTETDVEPNWNNPQTPLPQRIKGTPHEMLSKTNSNADSQTFSAWSWLCFPGDVHQIDLWRAPCHHRNHRECECPGFLNILVLLLFSYRSRMAVNHFVLQFEEKKKNFQQSRGIHQTPESSV